MAVISYEGEPIPVQPGLSVLDTLLHRGHDIPHGCRAGLCQCCLMQATAGTIPEAAQSGLRDTLRHQGYFLACRCRPQDDLEVRLSGADATRLRATVTGHERLGADISRLRLEARSAFTYRPGQYITLWRDRRTGRSYSLASVPGQDPDLELHVRHIPGGQLSTWVLKELKVGDQVWIQGPEGTCFYVPAHTDRSLLLVGTGTGLAPLYGILRDALARGHGATIHLFQGALDFEGLYLVETLTDLAKRYPNFRYHPCVLNSTGLTHTGVTVGPVGRLALNTISDLSNWKVYLCGDPEFVHALRKQAFLAGAGMEDIYADAFTPTFEPGLSA